MSDETGDPARVVSRQFGIIVETLKTLLVCIKKYTRMIGNYVKTAGLVSLHISLYVVFQNLVALVITSGETTWGYQELQGSHKLKHRPRHYNWFSSMSQLQSRKRGSDGVRRVEYYSKWL